MQNKEKVKCGCMLGQMQTEFTTQLWFEVFCLILKNHFFNIFKIFVLGWLLANASGFFWAGEGSRDKIVNTDTIQVVYTEKKSRQ